MRVIKLGGSLLDLDGLAPRLRSWLAKQPAMPSVMITGGGAMADVVRDAFARHGLGEEEAHWLCIRILDITADLVAHLLPEAKVADHLDPLRAEAATAPLVVFRCERFLREEESRRFPSPLPHCWAVTSDSIAARLAAAVEAEELVLLKSSLPASPCTLQEAADAGYVDKYFPAAAAELPVVRCVNLRKNEYPELRLSSREGLPTNAPRKRSG